VAADPAFVMEGIPEPVHAAVRDAVEGAIRRHNPKKDDEEKLRETVRRAARGAADDAWGKKPITRVEVVWV
jgi:ribonuclease J